MYRHGLAERFVGEHEAKMGPCEEKESSFANV
jgi:hypothetical protein